MEYFEHPFYLEDIEEIAKDERIRDGFSGKCVAVTGASGMLGTILVDSFMEMNRKHDAGIIVLAMSRNMTKLLNRFRRYEGNPSLVLIEGDITKEFAPKGCKPDYIIHAASNTHPLEYSGDPIGTITTNVFGTWRILEWLKKSGRGRLLLVSSVEIYGESISGETPFREKDFGYIDCNTLRAGYPESKRLSETMIQAYLSEENTDSVISRLCRVYGPTLEKDDSKALSQFLRKGLEGKDIVLKSEGNQYYSYLYAADAVSAILYTAVFGEKGEAYNAASLRSNARLKELAGMIADISKTSVVFELPDEKERQGFSKATAALLDPGKLEELGWSARFSIEEGIGRTLKILSGGE